MIRTQYRTYTVKMQTYGNCLIEKCYVEQMQENCATFIIFLSIVTILFFFCFLTDADPENNTMITASTWPTRECIHI